MCGGMVVEFVEDALTAFAFEGDAVAALCQEAFEVAVRLS